MKYTSRHNKISLKGKDFSTQLTEDAMKKAAVMLASLLCAALSIPGTAFATSIGVSCTTNNRIQLSSVAAEGLIQCQNGIWTSTNKTTDTLKVQPTSGGAVMEVMPSASSYSSELRLHTNSTGGTYHVLRNDYGLFVLGTRDLNALSLQTNSTERIGISNTGTVSLNGPLTANHDISLNANSIIRTADNTGGGSAKEIRLQAGQGGPAGGNGGAIALYGGAGRGGGGGSLYMMGGAAGMSGASAGSVTVGGGYSQNGWSGSVTLQGGPGGSNGIPGNINLNGGSTTRSSTRGGSITLTPGTGPQDGMEGDIILNGRVNLNGPVNVSNQLRFSDGTTLQSANIDGTPVGSIQRFPSTLRALPDRYVELTASARSFTTAEFPELAAILSPTSMSPPMLEGKLTATTPSTFALFGLSGAISADGNTLALGASGENSKGAAYIYTRSGNAWALQQRLQPATLPSQSNYGYSFAFSGDGNTLAVGAQYEQISGLAFAGSVYVYRRSGSSWTEIAKLTADVPSASESFGYALGMSADANTILVGAYYNDRNGMTDAGAAYVFVNNGSGWVQQAMLTASDAAANDHFGIDVALSIDGNTAAIGAKGAQGTYHADAGAVYIYTRSGSTWTQQTKIGSPYPSTEWFGGKVSLSDDANTLAVGAQTTSSVYIYTRSGISWTQQAKLTSSPVDAGQSFGTSVDLTADGNTLLVGAPYADHSGVIDPGAAFVFKRSGTTWTQSEKWVDSSPVANTQLGFSVGFSADGSAAFVGSMRATESGASFAGHALTFRGMPSYTIPARPDTSFRYGIKY